jgi:hypothetical protein
MLSSDPSSWLNAGFRPESKVETAPCACNSGIPRGFSPQALGDAVITDDPGNVTGEVPIYRPIPREMLMEPQAVVMQGIPKYVPGDISDTVPFDRKTLLMYIGVV